MRYEFREKFVDVGTGCIGFSSSVLGAKDITLCAAIAVYSSSIAALGHGYPVPIHDYITQFEMPGRIRREFTSRGYKGALLAQVSASDDSVLGMIEYELSRNSIELVDYYISEEIRDIIFDAREKKMFVLFQRAYLIAE